MVKFIESTEQAKLIRAALEAEYPSFKFSVRCSRGSAINVRWEDGPSLEDVTRLVRHFEGGYFDGMEDYRGGYTHSLNGEEVSFSADFIFTSRVLSQGAVTEVMGKMGRSYAIEGCAEYGYRPKIELIEEQRAYHSFKDSYSFIKGLGAEQSLPVMLRKY